MKGYEMYVGVVENAIQLLGIDPVQCRLEEFANWRFKRGSASIIMYLRMSQSRSGDRPVLVISSNIMDVPIINREAFYRALLEYNFSFVNESFSINNHVLYLSTARYCDGLDAGEVVALLDSLSYIADAIDDKLRQEFGNPNTTSSSNWNTPS